MIPQTITKSPPENSRISPSFFFVGKPTCQNMGTGTITRMISVVVFKANVTKRLILERAGWHISKSVLISTRHLADKDGGLAELTAWIRIDLKVAWKWMAGKEKTSNDCQVSGYQYSHSHP